MAKQDDYVRITLRIPAELHHRLVEVVADQPHSMNAEIIRCIERGLAHRDTPGQPPRSANEKVKHPEHHDSDWSTITSQELIMTVTSAAAKASAEALAKQKEALKAEILRELQRGKRGETAHEVRATGAAARPPRSGGRGSR